MSWDVVMFGSLTVPERNLEEWLTTSVSPEEFPWLEELGGLDASTATPEALLDALAQTTIAPHHLFNLNREGAELRFEAYMSEDPYRDACQGLCMLFASAAQFGGAGNLTFYGYQGIRFGERLTISAQGVALAQLSLRELPYVERSKEFKELDRQIHARFDSLVGRPSAPHNPRKARWMIHPFTGRKVRMPIEA